MPEYDIFFVRSARRELEALPETIAQRVLKRIRLSRGDPRPQGARKLQGNSQLWRIRVGDYRVIYEINDEQRVLEVAHVRHRREAYRDI